jgi:hypothetical protein
VHQPPQISSPHASYKSRFGSRYTHPHLPITAKCLGYEDPQIAPHIQCVVFYIIMAVRVFFATSLRVSRRRARTLRISMRQGMRNIVMQCLDGGCAICTLICSFVVGLSQSVGDAFWTGCSGHGAWNHPTVRVSRLAQLPCSDPVGVP